MQIFVIIIDTKNIYLSSHPTSSFWFKLFCKENKNVHEFYLREKIFPQIKIDCMEQKYETIRLYEFKKNGSYYYAAAENFSYYGFACDKPSLSDKELKTIFSYIKKADSFEMLSKMIAVPDDYLISTADINLKRAADALEAAELEMKVSCLIMKDRKFNLKTIAK